MSTFRVHYNTLAGPGPRCWPQSPIAIIFFLIFIIFIVFYMFEGLTECIIKKRPTKCNKKSKTKVQIGLYEIKRCVKLSSKKNQNELYEIRSVILFSFSPRDMCTTYYMGRRSIGFVGKMT
jgi:hypothetical protein